MMDGGGMSGGAADDGELLSVADIIDEALAAVADTDQAPSTDDEGEGADAGGGAARGGAACTRKARKDLRVRVDADPATCQNLRAAVLCIGLGEYKSLPGLPNATRDARALCEKVNALPHCRASLLADLPDRRALQKGIRTFLKDPGLQKMPPETVLINYSGHGMQLGSTVYVLPGDADLSDATCEPDADFLPIRDILKWCREDLDGPARDLDPPRQVAFVLVVDACRVAEMDFSTLSSSLEPPPASAPKKWSLCFSCSRDSTASDGPQGTHSPFAQELLHEGAGIFAAGVPLKRGLEEACRRMREQHEGQVPMPVGLQNINEDWCLCPAPSLGAAAGTESVLPVPFSPRTRCSLQKVGAQHADAARFWQDALMDADHVPWSIFAAALKDEFDFVEDDILDKIRDKVDLERNGIISAMAFNVFTRKLGLEGACRAAFRLGVEEERRIKAEQEKRAQKQAQQAQAQKAQEQAFECTIVSAGMDSAVGGMGKYLSNSAIQLQACERLFNLAYNNYANKVTIAALGGIQAILKAMGAHADNAGVQEQACRALCSLATDNEDNQVAIAALGGMEAILKAMGEHPDNAAVQEHACGALYNLADIEDNEVEIAALGGIEAIHKAMGEHPDNAGVQEWACVALCSLACNDDNQVAIAALGGIEAIHKAMSEHLDNAGVQEQACWALCNIAHNDENQIKIAALGGIQAIHKAMGEHPDNGGVQEQACRALYSLTTDNAANQDTIAALGGIQAIHKAMGAHVNNADVQEHACGALRNLAYNNAANKVKIAVLGGIQAILKAMGEHPDNAEVQEEACGALKSLAANAANKVKIATLGGVEAIHNAMGAHPDVDGVQEQACGALYNLAG